MGLRIATNIQSLAAQRYLAGNSRIQNQALERLASGQRINRAGDDAAGLAISEKLKSSIRSMKQAARNASDGISMVQTAEGALNEVSSILIRLRELSVQAASDTVGAGERGFIDMEIQNLKAEIDRIANSTEYNGTKLLNGVGGALEIQIGIDNNPLLSRLVLDTSDYLTSLDGLGIQEVTALDRTSAQTNLSLIDDAINRLNGSRATLGALQNRLQSTVNNLNIYRENLEGANSRIRDTDMAEEMSELTKSNILAQSNIAVLSQANTNAQYALKLLS